MYVELPPDSVTPGLGLAGAEDWSALAACDAVDADMAEEDAEDDENQREVEDLEGERPQAPEQQLEREEPTAVVGEAADRLRHVQRTLLHHIGNTALRVDGDERNRHILGIRDEMQGIVRNAEGREVRRLDSAYMGPSTRAVLSLWVNYLEQEALPAMYSRLASANCVIPAPSPIVLPLDSTGRPVSTSAFMRSLREPTVPGESPCNLHISRNSVPAWDELRRLSDADDFLQRSENVLSRHHFERMQEIATRRARRMNMPDGWQMNTPERCAAAMTVMDVATETGRIIECLGYLSQEMEGPARNALLQALTRDLPPGVVVQREGGRPDGAVIGVRYTFPNNLDLMQPAYRNQLRAMLEFCDRYGRQADQMLSTFRNMNDPNNQIAWLDVEVPNGWVRRVVREGGVVDYEHTRSASEPAVGAGENGTTRGPWQRCNLLEYRCEVIDVLDSGDNLGRVRIVPTMEYRNCPCWSYLNLYRPQANGCDTVRRPDDNGRPADEWISVRTGPDDRRFMRCRDLRSHVESQEFHRIAGLVTTATMDISMLVLGVGEVAAGARAVRTAATGFRTVEVAQGAARTAAQAGRVTESAQLLRLATSNPAGAAFLQQQLRQAGQGAITRGLREITLALTAIPTMNAAGREAPGLSHLGAARGYYFTAGLLRMGVYDTPASLIRWTRGMQPHVSLAQALSQQSLSTAPLWIRGVESVGNWGFHLAQYPFGWEQYNLLMHNMSHRLPEVDPRAEAQRRGDDAANARVRFEQERQVMEAGGGQRALESLEELRRTLQSNSAPDNIIVNQIMNEASGLMREAYWMSPNFVGPPDPAHVQRWEARRHTFIAERVAPLFLPSGETLSQAERTRAGSPAVRLAELRQNRSFTAEQLQQAQMQQTLGMPLRSARLAGACALFYLCRNADGTFLDASAPETPGNSAANQFFQRQVTIPGWGLSRSELGTPEPGRANVLPLTRIEQPARTVTQQISVNDVFGLLERELGPNAPAAHRFEIGSLLVRAGMPAQTYAACLRDMIGAEGTAPRDRSRAIVELGSIIQALRVEEGLQGPARAATRLSTLSLSSGLTSRDLQEYLLTYSGNAGNARDARALARYTASFYDRTNLTPQELNRLREVVSGQPPGLTFTQYVQDLQRVAFQTPTSAAHWEQRLHAALQLSELLQCSDGEVLGQDLLCSQDDLNRLIATCVAAPSELARASQQAESRLTALQQLLDETQDAEARRQLVSQLERCRQDASRLREQQPLVGDVAVQAVNALLQPLQSAPVGTPRCRLHQMDASGNQSLRALALDVRREAVGLVVAPSDPGAPAVVRQEDARVRSSIIGQLEPLLRDTHLRAPGVNAANTITALLELRQDAAAGMEAVLQIRPAGNPVTGRYGGLCQLAASNEVGVAIRQSALGCLAALGSLSSERIIYARALVENEPEPEVRLAAVRALQTLLPVQAMNDLAMGVINRRDDDRARPPERDPAVAHQWRHRFIAQGGGSHPDSAQFRQWREDANLAILRGVDALQARVLIDGRPEYNWLRGNDFRLAVANAMQVQFGGRGWASWWADQNWAPGGPTPRVSRREYQAREDAHRQFHDRFDRLCQTAVTDNGELGREARLLLLHIITDTGRDFAHTGMDARLPRGATGFGLGIDSSTFSGLQVMAVEALRDCVTRRDANGNLVAMPQAIMTEMEDTLLAAFRHPETTDRSRMVILSAIDSLARRERAQQGNDRVSDISGRAAQAIIPVLIESSFGARYALLNEEQREYCHTLAFRAFQFLREQPVNPALLAAVEGLGRARGVPAHVRQQALETVAFLNDRVLTVAVPRDQVNGENLQHRVHLVQSAARYAAPLDRLQANARIREADRDTETLNARIAVDLICRGTRQCRIRDVHDPRGPMLVELLAPMYQERVRVAAAIAIMAESDVSAHQEDAVVVLVDQAVCGSRMGLRRDAQQVLSTLSRPEVIEAAEEQLQAVQSRLLADMRRIHNQGAAAADHIAEDAFEHSILTRMQARFPNGHVLLEQYASALTNVAMIYSRRGAVGPARGMLQTAINLYRGTHPDDPVVNAADRYSMSWNMTRHRGTELMHQVTFALDRFADLPGNDPRDAHSAMATATYLRRGLSTSDPVLVRSEIRTCQTYLGIVLNALRECQQLQDRYVETQARLTEARRINAINLPQIELEASRARGEFITSLSSNETSWRRMSGHLRGFSRNVEQAFGAVSAPALDYVQTRVFVLTNLIALERRRDQVQRLSDSERIQLANHERECAELERAARTIRQRLGPQPPR